MKKKHKKRSYRRRHDPPISEGPRVVKLCGADIELGNFILGLDERGGTDYEASRLLLGEIDGLPRSQRYRAAECDCQACRDRRKAQNGGGYFKRDGPGGIINPQDWGRKYLPANGGCIYIDLNHLELCLPEVLSAFDHVACWHAMLRIARGALEAANEKLPRGINVQALANNSDGNGNSYGSHLDFLITRRAWDNIFRRKVQQMLYLAAFQTSSIVFTGQGKVGSENGAPAVAYQLSQRADFFETLMSIQTTHNRPIVNSRDEPLCGRHSRVSDEATSGLARLHVIFFDNTLSHVASLLKVGVMQIVLSMIEADRINPRLLLDDPLDAVQRWSHDPGLKARARMADSRQLTAVEVQLLFLEEAKRFAARGGLEAVVPRADDILSLWEDTLLKLEEGDFASLACRLDWVLKLSILQRVLEQKSDLGWESPQIKHLDHVYSSLDATEGLYWAYEKSGFVEQVVSQERIEQFMHNPPEQTRAWARAMLLRVAGPELIDDVNWDFIKFKFRDRGFFSTYRTLDMANPLRFTRAATEPLFNQVETLEEALDALSAMEGEDSQTLEIGAGALIPMSVSDDPGSFE
jgi:Pup amidohydrolase